MDTLANIDTINGLGTLAWMGLGLALLLIDWACFDGRMIIGRMARLIG